MNSDRKWKFQRFYQARCERNHIAHGQFSLATSYKMYSVSSPTKYGNFIGNLIHISVIRRLFSLTLFRKLKIHQFVKKNSQDAGVNRAKKGYHCIIFFYTKEVTDCPLIVSNSRVSLAFIYQHLEYNVNDCACSVCARVEVICIILKALSLQSFDDILRAIDIII